MDPSCSYLACSYSNKSLCMYDAISGELVTRAVGHGEVITGVIFLPDCKHVVSVSPYRAY
jgi:WD40 repeat protein